MTTTEYRKGQIWLDTDDYTTIRRVTSPTTHTAFYTGLESLPNRPNFLIEEFGSTLLYNPPAEIKEN